MRCVLGFDGGGTKTECVLMDECGIILARSRAGPSNPLRVGVDAAVAALQAAAQEALAATKAGHADIAAIVAGLAGAGHAETAKEVSEDLRRMFPGSRVKVLTDLELALETMGDGPAVVLVAGTGSAAIGRGADGRVARAGGYGPVIGDEGSAYDIGRKAIAAALLARDRSGADSTLGRRILQGLGFLSWEELQARARDAADEVLPRVFPFVAAEADAGDDVAQDLLRDAAAELAKLVGAVIERLGLDVTSFALGKTGGLIGGSTYFDEQLDAMLFREAPNARTVALPMPPAEAAARLALRLIGESGDSGRDS